MATDEIDLGELKARAIEMGRDPREGLTARDRAIMACIVIPQAIQQWMVEAGAVEPLLDSIEKTILAAENGVERYREALAFYADPFGKTDAIPDFYSELSFGDRAAEALGHG